MEVATGRVNCTDDMIERLARAGFRAGAFCWILEQITRFLEDGRICLSNNAAEREKFSP